MTGSQALLNATAGSLLGFLQAGPKSGYDLALEIDQSIGNFWNVTSSQIYRELHALEKSGLVERLASGARARQPYQITPAGRDAFSTWISNDLGEALIRIPLLVSTFFAESIDAKTRLRILRDHRAQHEAKLREYRKRLPEIERDAPVPALTMRFGLMYEEMVLRWLDSLPWQ